VIVAGVQEPEFVLSMRQTVSKENKRVVKEDSPSASFAARLVGKFPTQNGWLIDVASNKRFDVVLERGLDGRIGVEKIMVLGAENLTDVDIHSSVIRPVIRAINGINTAICTERKGHTERQST